MKRNSHDVGEGTGPILWGAIAWAVVIIAIIIRMSVG